MSRPQPSRSGYHVLEEHMAPKNLQEVIDAAASPVELLRNSQIGAYVYPVVPADFRTGATSRRAWRETAVLFDQSHHMVNLFLRGPGRDQADLRHRDQLASPTSRSTRPSSTCRRRQPATSSATASCSTTPRTSTSTSAARPAANWLQFHAETGGYERRDRQRRPLAARARMGKPVTRQLLPLPDPGPERVAGASRSSTAARSRSVKFFNMGEMNDRRHARCATLRHGMAGAPGLEIWGPYAEHDEIRERDRRGRARSSACVPVGSRAYSSNTLESGWIPSPLPAIYTGDEAAGLPRVAAGRRLRGDRTRSAGSFVSDNIEDYYLTPWELGYGHFVKFDHDFIGRDALEKIEPETQRKKVTLAWDAEDLGKVLDRRCPERRRARTTSSSTCRWPTTARRTTTRSWTPTARSSATRCSPATAPTRSAACRSPPSTRDRARGHRAQGRLGRAERRHAQGQRSSRTSRPRSASWSARCRTRRSRVSSTPRAGAPPACRRSAGRDGRTFPAL